MSTVIVDGVETSHEWVTPAIHHYIGMWRPPENPLLKIPPCGVIVCKCNASLHYAHELREHYIKGCFDLPQYKRIDK